MESCTAKLDENMAALLDKAYKYQERRIEKLTAIAKENPQLFVKHISYFLSRVDLQDYNQYAKEISFLSKTLKEDDGDYFSKHSKELKQSAKGFALYLKLRLYDKNFFVIAEKAGIRASIITELIRKRSIEIFSIEEKEIYNNHSTMAQYTRPNDKIAQNLDTATADEWAKGGMIVEEIKKKGKRKKVTTKLKFDIDRLKELGANRLDSFDLFVMWTCMALREAGKVITTINGIYRAMTGKDVNETPTQKMKDDIMKSLDKIMVFTGDIDAKDICQIYGYKGNARYKGVILPLEYLDNVIVNGAEVDTVVSFPYESQLMKLARIKNNQFITYDAKLLNVPARSTRQTVVVVPYLLQRIESAKHKEMKNIILIDTVMEVTQWTDKRSRLVSLIEECFNHWQHNGYVKRYSFEKRKVGRHEQVISLRFTV